MMSASKMMLPVTLSRRAGVRARRLVRIGAAVLVAIAALTPAQAQRGMAMGRSIPDIVGRIDRATLDVPGIADRASRQLPEAAIDHGLAVSAEVRGLMTVRGDKARALVSANPQIIDRDRAGAPVIRSEIIAIAPSPDSLAIARAAGFSIARESRLEGLDLPITILSAPAGLDTRHALSWLRKRDPGGNYDFNHIYFTSGSGDAVLPAMRGAAPVSPRRVGLVDTGLAEADGSVARRDLHIEQRAFAVGGIVPQVHGLAVASVLLSQLPKSRAAGVPHTLYVADVYGTLPSGGSAEACARALGWMAQNKVPVINVSLVGPPNLLMAAAVRVMVARGFLIVAPVGNDGPSAKPLYPASYPGVVAVTAVGVGGRLLPEAGRALHVEFAASGLLTGVMVNDRPADMRGTSFAAPIVAGRLSTLTQEPGITAAQNAIAALASEAVDIGAPGRDKIFGFGLIGGQSPHRIAANP
jgi:hypothetical protein